MDDSSKRGGGEEEEEEEEVVEKLPGFRFHPTEEELLNFYLKQTIMGNKFRAEIITFLNIYNYDPRELPGLAKIGGEREWYFFVPRKQGTGGRPNRTTEKGFWKATGSDRKILSSTTSKLLGLRKTLVFYQGRAPRGTRTDWIMNEYRLPPPHHLHTIDYSPPKDIVLCKIYRKATSMKVLEQRAAVLMEECKSPEITMDSTSSFSNQLVHEEDKETYMSSEISSMAPPPTFKKENHHDDTIDVVVDHHVEAAQSSSTSLVTCSTQEDQVQDIMTTSKNLVLPNGMMANLGELQLPAQLATMDWTQDAFWSQFRSPWLDNFASFLPLCQ